MKRLILLSLAAGLLTQCHQDDPRPSPTLTQLDLLPPATQTGRRTFGFLLNGRAWNVEANPFNGPRFTADYTYQRLRLYASGGIDSINTAGLQVGGILYIDIRNITSTGIYIVAGKDSSSVHYIGYNNSASKCQYNADAIYPATINVTKLDFQERIVSGIFSFTLKNPGCKNVVATEGRFDSLF